MMKRIFICSPRSMFSQGLEKLLDEEPGIEVVGWESRPEEAIRCIKEVQPDVVLFVTSVQARPTGLDGQCLMREGIKTSHH